jgi:hypothetical protein
LLVFRVSEERVDSGSQAYIDVDIYVCMSYLKTESTYKEWTIYSLPSCSLGQPTVRVGTFDGSVLVEPHIESSTLGCTESIDVHCRLPSSSYNHA